MKKTYHDPVTGDPLTTGEYVSWMVQGIIRKWTFLILISLITIAAWTTRNETVLLWWNLGASYLALVIESIVGLAMYGQTRRDAVALREVRTLVTQLEQQETLLLQLVRSSNHERKQTV